MFKIILIGVLCIALTDQQETTETTESTTQSTNSTEMSEEG